MHTFGARRVELLGTLINATLLMALSLEIISTALPRFFNPVSMDVSYEYIVIAACGIPVNLITAAFFIGARVEVVHAHGHGGGKEEEEEEGDEGGHSHGHSHGHGDENMNMRTLIIHSLGDAATSVAVMIVGILLNMNKMVNRWLARVRVGPGLSPPVTHRTKTAMVTRAILQSLPTR